MPRSADAIVKPKMLVWAREDAGFSQEEAANKITVKTEILLRWESGDRRPTIIQLRKLAKAYKRPLAIFYLPEPPKGYQALKDYRHLPGEETGILSPALRFAIRRAHNLRELAVELYDDLEGPPPVFHLKAKLTDDTEQLGLKIRDILGINFQAQTEWCRVGGYEPLNKWREALEGAGVLVFQTRGVELSEMRGFSIADFPFPAIALNNKDAVSARIFTMIHELCHIMLHEGGLCSILDISDLPTKKKRFEYFCNMVAGAALVPKENLMQEKIIKANAGAFEWSDNDLSTLSSRYGVSREVILRRLLIQGLTTNEFYEIKRKQFREEYYEWLRLKKDRDREQKGGPKQQDIVTSSTGYFFVRLVLANYYQDKITLSDVSDYLDVRLKHLAKIEDKVMGKSLTLETA
jgi:Zn-dependent peptidase ImmA (M78 family)/DNA-binding XRE family transcriptional regulator